MAENIFASLGAPPIRIEVRLARDVQTFRDLNQVVNTLSYISRPRSFPSPQVSKGRGSPTRLSKGSVASVELINFRVGSEPTFNVLTDPAWLAVFIGFLARYPEMRRGARELTQDIEHLVSDVAGLTRRQIAMLEVAVRIFLDEVLGGVEHMSQWQLHRVRTARRRLMGDSDAPPQIRVIFDDATREQ